MQAGADVDAPASQFRPQLLAAHARVTYRKHSGLGARLLRGKNLKLRHGLQRPGEPLQQPALVRAYALHAPGPDELRAGHESRYAGYIVRPGLKHIRQKVRHCLAPALRTGSAGHERLRALPAEQNARPLKDGIKAEELNLLIGSDAVDDENVKEAVKLNTMILLNEKYGITEKEFMRAEIEITPAYKSRDVGFDRSMVGGYGHDDRVDAYPALMAEIETKNPAYTTVCVLTDKEEIGSDGVTGMQSMYVFHFMQELCRAAGQDDILAFRHSVCLSADVTAAYDPTWASAFEPMNGTYAGRGVAIFKYTGGGSKGSASDACAELVSDITRMLDNGNVAWQIGELGRLDLGGGGTIAKYVANRGIPVLDIGVPVLSMHAPFEVIHKNDLYMAYRAFSLFNNAQ